MPEHPRFTPDHPERGLWIPSGAGQQTSPIKGVPADLPRELLPTPEFIVRRSRDEDVFPRITRCAVTLADITLPGVATGIPQSLDDVIRELEKLPFEGAMTFLSPIAADIYHYPDDVSHQLELAARLFPPVIIGEIKQFTEEGQGHIVFDERYIAILQRLLIEHAADSSDEMTEDERATLVALLLAMPAALTDDSPPITDPDHPTQEERDAFALYTLRIGAYYDRPYLLEAAARAQGILVEGCGSDELSDLAERYPVEDWMRDDHNGADLADQLAAGFALAFGSGATESDLTLEQRLERHLDNTFLADSSVAVRAEQILSSVSATRAEFKTAFANAGQTDAHVAWDYAVFEQHPFLRQESGRLQLISPRAVVSWLTDGLYFRGLDCARNRPHPDPKKARSGKTLVHGYTDLVGRGAEVYVRRLTTAVHTTQVRAGATHVAPECEYYVSKSRKDSSDLYVVQAPEIVAIEVFSGRLPRDARVTGDPDEMERAVTKLVISKLDELHRAIEDLLEGHIPLPDLDLAPVKRVWPMLVLTGQGLLSTPISWGMTRERLTEGAFTDPRVAAPTLCDLDDYESLLSLVEHDGWTLPNLLAELQVSPFADLPPRNWIHERFGARVLRPTFVTDTYERAGSEMRIKLFGTASRDERPLED